MTTSEYDALSLKEKEEYWLKALEHKSIGDDLTDEQWDYEWDEHILYEDKNILMTKNYVNELEINNKKRRGGLTACFSIMMNEDLGGDSIKLEEYKGKTIVDYMRERGFPLTFLTWI